LSQIPEVQPQASLTKAFLLALAAIVIGLTLGLTVGFGLNKANSATTLLRSH
jgi:ABC-type dipeptide/oligopeptide/nickel transport system permease subunit